MLACLLSGSESPSFELRHLLIVPCDMFIAQVLPVFTDFSDDPQAFYCLSAPVADVADPVVAAVVADVAEPVVVFVVLVFVAEPVVFAALVSAADAAEPQASVDIAVAFVVLVPVSGIAAGVYSPGRPRFPAFPNAD